MAGEVQVSAGGGVGLTGGDMKLSSFGDVSGYTAGGVSVGAASATGALSGGASGTIGGDASVVVGGAVSLESGEDASGLRSFLLALRFADHPAAVYSLQLV